MEKSSCLCATFKEEADTEKHDSHQHLAALEQRKRSHSMKTYHLPKLINLSLEC
jgi:hypothetical protein